MLYSILVVQSFTLPDDVSDEELEQIAYDVGHNIPLTEHRPSVANLLATQINNGPIALVGERRAILHWLTARTGGQ